jgi:hypothetical protein
VTFIVDELKKWGNESRKDEIVYIMSKLIPTKVPVTAMVPNNTKMEEVQLCSSMKEGKESHQSLNDFMPKQNQSSSDLNSQSLLATLMTTEGNNNGNEDN